MSKWKTVNLGDVATEITVGFVGTMAEHYTEDGVRFLRSQDIFPYRIDTADNKFVSYEFHRKIRKSELCSGDVVIVRTGKPGTCAVVPQDFGIANCSDLVIVRPGPDLDSRYLCYFVNAMAQNYVDSYLVGAVQQHFNVSAARTLPIPLPEITEQRRIADILGAFDDKIALNQKINEMLEMTARALFQSWFVDFDPVRVKARGGDPVIELDLAPDIAALFSDSFEDSSIGMIPEGWTCSVISDAAEIVGGGTPSTSNAEFWDGPHAWATPRDLSRLNAPVLLSTERTITDIGLRQISSGLLAEGTVLMSSRAPIGYLAIAKIPVAINQGFIALKPTRGISSAFLINWCLTNMDAIKGRSNGSTFMEISKTNFRPLSFVRPDNKVLEAFDELATPVYEQITINEIETQYLSDIRDWLLPNLLSGEITVAEGEEP